MRMVSGRRVATVAATAALIAAVTAGAQADPAPDAPACGPDEPPVELAGEVSSDDEGTYQVHPFEVAEGTTRVEVAYDWDSLVPDDLQAQTVVDAGLWGPDDYRAAEAFRGWSGSRQGRVAAGQDPIVVQQDAATRGYRPAPIEPGTWWLDLGFALVAPSRASWQATITCTDVEVGAAFAPAPVDPDLVLDERVGWYHADLHAHGHHSAPDAPPWDDIVAQARAAGLDVLPVTEYVTGQHWDELGPVQQANPDVLLWPGREIITYQGHAIALGETRSVLEYRHGFEDVSIADIQMATLDNGALFGVAHPTFFPGPLARFCRGCEYTLEEETDWSRVDTIEVLTGPVLAQASDIGFPADPGARMTNPFVETAVAMWEELLQDGYRITAVSGSDSKANEPQEERERVGIGSSATAIHADELSRDALAEGLRQGRAYVRTLGAQRSPALEVVAMAPDGTTAGIGDDLAADEAELEVTVTDGEGDVLVVIRNGEAVGSPIPVDAEEFTATVPIERDPDSEGPLGSWVRVETIRGVEVVDGVEVPVELPLDELGEADVLRFPSTIANPLFLTGAAGPPADPPGEGEPGDGRTEEPGPPAERGGPAGAPERGQQLPATGAAATAVPLGLLLLAATAAMLRALRPASDRDPAAGRRG